MVSRRDWREREKWQDEGVGWPLRHRLRCFYVGAGIGSVLAAGCAEAKSETWTTAWRRDAGEEVGYHHPRYSQRAGNPERWIPPIQKIGWADETLGSDHVGDDIQGTTRAGYVWSSTSVEAVQTSMAL